MKFSGISVKLADAGMPIVTIAAREMRLKESEIAEVRLIKQSVDARDKHDIRIVYSLDVRLKGEGEPQYDGYMPPADCVKTDERPVVIGAGPAGLFAAWLLAKSGARPILIERGRMVKNRAQDVDALMQSGILNEESNLLFGEGGAGTFSDGKLNTGIKDARIPYVLKTLIEHGAPDEIAWAAKPHVGTDVLRRVVVNLRAALINMGCEVRFECRVEDIITDGKRLIGLKTTRGDIAARRAIFAIGHSARDTLRMLHARGIVMEKKAFSIGARIEHPQKMINFSQYGAAAPLLSVADYKLTTHLKNGRGAYTFCMCPGGFVVPATAHSERVNTNGMSLHARDGQNANSALLIGVSPEDFPGDTLSGIAFQEKWERAAYEIGGGNYRAPVQQVGDFLKGVASKNIGALKPTYQPGITPANLAECLPSYVVESLREAIRIFDNKIAGFAISGAMLTGVEMRSSSPARIMRDETGQASIAGIYPCGEGAGYAGGIISAAVDGMKAAEQIIHTEE